MMDAEELAGLLGAPEGRELEIGLALLEMSQLGNFPSRHRSLREWLPTVSSRDYTSVMRWVRAAGALEGPDDARAAWGVHRLLELLRIEDADLREAFIARHDVGRMPVRDLRREVTHFLGRREEPRRPRLPHEFTAEAVRRALARADIDARAAGLRITAGRLNSNSRIGARVAAERVALTHDRAPRSARGGVGGGR